MVSVPRGPPPQAVLEKRSLWILLLLLLTATSLLEFSTMDIAGGLLTALMLFMACMMVTDGMAELQRYALAFSMLCMLCLFFNTVPLLSSLGGRSEVWVQPIDRRSFQDELRITYTTVIKTTPFFDSRRDYAYNGGSLAMILSPLSMLLGAYLAGGAHVELQQAGSALDLAQRAPGPSRARFSGPSHRLR